MRSATVERNTKETKIKLTLNIDGTGTCKSETGVGFFDHMLDGFARHGLFDLDVKVDGDLFVDCHHTIEDTGIVLGNAIKEAVGDKCGIKRYGSCILPMDEALVLCAVDISGRATLGWKMEIPSAKVGTFDTELVKEFWLAFSRTMGLTIHFQQMAGENSHHIIEAMFKGAGRALGQAVAIDPRFANEIPSTKGVL